MTVVGVLGGSGGVGASSFAAVVADVAGPTMLVDCDAVGGGIDVLLGIESVPGARWSGLRVDGGHLDPGLLVAGLPRWREVAVLAADVSPPAAPAVLQVVGAAAALGSVVLDLPRAPSDLRQGLITGCELCLVVVRADVGGVAAARAVLTSMPSVVCGLVLRRGSLGEADVARLLDVPVLGVLPDERPLRSRAASRVACGVVDGLGAA